MSGSQRSANCPSDYRIDKLLAEELDPAEAGACRAHVDSCSRCTARVQTLDDARSAFARNAPSLAFPAPAIAALRGRNRYRMAAGASAMAAAAAGFLLFLQSPRELAVAPAAPAAPAAGWELGTRTKGDQFGIYFKRGERQERWQAGQSLAPGDILRFTCRSERVGYVTVVSIDPTGAVGVYFPSADRPHAVPAGFADVLPGAIELDDTVGRERLWFFFCAEPVLPSSLRDLVRAQPNAFVSPSGCELTRMEVAKIQGG